MSFTFLVTDQTGSVGEASKDNLDTLGVLLDFSQWLYAGELLGSVTDVSLNSTPNVPTGTWQLTPYVNLAPPPAPTDTYPLVFTSATPQNGGTTALVLLAAGTPGITYVASLLATTTFGRQKTIEFYVVVSTPVNPSMISSAITNPAPTTTVVIATTSLAQGVNGSVFVENAAGAAITITLPPSPTLGQTIQAMDASGNAGTYPITWVGAGGALIAGKSSQIWAANFQSASFQWNGSSWNIL